MRRWVPCLPLVFLLVVGSLGLSDVYAQSVDELRQEFERKLRELRAEFEAKLREAVEREVAKVRQENQQDVKSVVKQALEAQPPQILLNPAPMPPAARKPALGLFLNVELSGVNLWGVETDYAAQNTPGSVFPQSRQTGRFRTVDVNRHFAASPTVGYYLPDGRGILSASFYHLSTAGSDGFRAPDAVLPSLLPPSLLGELGFFPDSATARNQIAISQFDARYQYPIQVTKIFGLTPEVGIRGLWFKNNVKSNYLFDPPDAGFNYSVDQRSNSWAVGPDIGLTGTWQLFRNFTFMAGGKGGYLLGQSTARQVFCRGVAFTSPGCGGAFNFKQTDSRGFPFVEGEFSLNYAFGADTRLTGLSASMGYRVGTFFSLFNRIRDIGDEETGATIVFDRLNLTYDSIFFKFQYLW